MDEAELDRLHADGYYSRDEWQDFWWRERAHALNAIWELERKLVEFREFAARCTKRIDGA